MLNVQLHRQESHELEQHLELDVEAEIDRICLALKQLTTRTLRKRGLTLGVSGGVDSAVCAALAVRALDSRHVQALLMPEYDSDPDGTRRGHELCETLGLEPITEDIGPGLQALGCYSRRDEAIRQVFPEYGEGYRQKIVVAGQPLGDARVNYFNLVIESPGGERQQARLPAETYRQIVAATNMKQRTRKQLEYYHAERLNHAVLGTPNRLEYELGFFVRGGDGLADIKPIAHLYKSQVYTLAEHLGVPGSIIEQPPSTDTYSLPQTQEEFYFALSFDKMDRALLAAKLGWSSQQAADALGISEPQMQRIFQDIEAKRHIAGANLRDALRIEA